MATFGERLIKIMAEKHVSQAELSRLTGIRQSSLSGYMLGTYEAKQDKIGLISRALGVSPSYLMGWEDEKKVYNTSEPLNLFTESSATYRIKGEDELIEAYRRFSEEGREKVLDYVRDLERTGLYIKNSENRVDKKK